MKSKYFMIIMNISFRAGIITNLSKGVNHMLYGYKRISALFLKHVCTSSLFTNIILQLLSLNDPNLKIQLQIDVMHNTYFKPSSHIL